MQCMECGFSAVPERAERTIEGYLRFRCRTCGKQFNERSAGLLNRARYPSDAVLSPAYHASVSGPLARDVGGYQRYTSQPPDRTQGAAV
jgi:hypothetical protein